MSDTLPFKRLSWINPQTPNLAGIAALSDEVIRAQLKRLELFIGYCDEKYGNGLNVAKHFSERNYALIREWKARRLKRLLQSGRQSPLKVNRHPILAGFVYLMESQDGTFKIGYSDNPTRRTHELDKKLIACIATSDMYLLEQSLHEIFWTKWVHHEFFALNQMDIEYFKTLAVQYE